MRRTTVVYLLLFLVAVGAYYFINNRPEPADILVTLEPEEPASYLFSAEDGVPTSIRIESLAGEVAEVARNSEGAWALTLPIEAAADQGLAEAAASQVTTLRILDTLPDIDLSIVGLKTPQYVLTIQFNDVERKTNIGVITPTGNGYYALDANGNVVIISASSVDALLNLLTNPPYLETPTPSPIPPTATETPLPITPETGTTTTPSTP